MASVKKFKKNHLGEYPNEVKELCKQMYLGLYCPEGQNFKRKINSIVEFTGIKKSTITNWQRRENWEGELAKEIEDRETLKSSDLQSLLDSIKMENIKAIEIYVRNNPNLADEDDLKKRVEAMKTILMVEDKLLSEEEREQHSPQHLLDELDKFSKDLNEKIN